MLKKFFILYDPDEKEAGGSSPTAESTVDKGTTVDNKGTSSDSQNGKETEEPQTLLDAVRETLDPKEKEKSEDDPDAEKSGSESEQDQSKEKEKGSTEEGTTVDEEGEKDKDKGPVPYERFESIVQERDTLKQQFESIKGKAGLFEQIDNYCQEFGINQEQFNYQMKIQALMNTDPAKALELLLPMVEQLQGFQGDKLPADLQKAVDDGTVPVQYAKEIAKLRAQNQFGQKKVEYDRARLDQERQAEASRQMREATTNWEISKRKLDPTYKEGSEKWVEVRDKFLAMLHVTKTDENGQTIPVNPVRNAKEMVALMESAYQQVNRRYSARLKPPVRNNLPSNGAARNNSTIKSIEEAPTLKDAVDFALSERK